MEILFEDASILVVNKPAGLATNPGGWEKGSHSRVEALTVEYGRIWIVHRLDIGTSGLVIFARNAEAHKGLNNQFEQHCILKIYHAICVGTPAWDHKIVNYPLRANVGHTHRTIVDPGKGKPAETKFQVLERNYGYALLAAVPTTGRTHQVRIHAYSIGFPLLGDVLYGARDTELLARPALHAAELTLSHPVTAEKMTFSAPYPQDFTHALAWLRTQA
jgi:RluA family pseudouridine synthase